MCMPAPVRTGHLRCSLMHVHACGRQPHSAHFTLIYLPTDGSNARGKHGIVLPAQAGQWQTKLAGGRLGRGNTDQL